MSAQVELQDMVAFVAVVEAVGFTEAARRMGTTKSVLSRRVSELERKLGAVLIERGARTLRPTEVGAVYYAKCVRILESVDAASDFVASFHGVVRGRLRVAVDQALLVELLAPALHAFALASPDLVLEVLADERREEEGGDVDLVIRPLSGDEQDHVVSVLRSYREILCASPGYLAAQGEPASPEALPGHAGLLDTGEDMRAGWRLQQQDGEPRLFRVQERLRSASARQLIAAAEAGLGITLQPDFLVAEALAVGRLQQVLPGWSGLRTELAALYTPSRRHSKKLRLLLDFLRDWFGAAPGDRPAG